MEPIVDFGLFEVAAASGLAWIARKICVRRGLRIAFTFVCVTAPAALVFVSRDELSRWLAALSLMTAIVNAAALFPGEGKRRG